MARPCIVVSGFGRCGSSLVMAMLARGGVRCVGSAPSFEDSRCEISGFQPEWFSALSECAVKLLSPDGLPASPAMPNHIVIWLDRDEHEQAKSMIKFLRFVGASVHGGRPAQQAFAASFRKDRPRARARLGLPGGTDGLTLKFEDIVTDPRRAARRIAEFGAQHGYTIDAGRMESVVWQRSPLCLPYMAEMRP